VLRELLDDVVIVREAELRETLVRLALEEHVIAEGAGALALAAGRRVAGQAQVRGGLRRQPRCRRSSPGCCRTCARARRANRGNARAGAT
jgi:hypothetical protein